mmetsp:Transcript_19342/g.37702  ORF Transcript_19342/g.37702 Transcript_19342/m.37702 type:complete len:81 (-) Transcript_19342:1100-1342(-)
MSPGYCTKVCCDESIEETCFSIFTGEADSCALIIDGGCPCADGEIKCGVTDAYSGMPVHLSRRNPFLSFMPQSSVPALVG